MDVSPPPVFDGNPLWLIGIAVVVIAILWFLIAGALQIDKRSGKRSDDDDMHFLH